jgi:hypothetical protein
VDWSSDLAEKLEAQPLKNVVASAGDQIAPGEIMLTCYGMEGGPLYALGPILRKMKEPLLTLDFKPTFTIEKLVGKMESAKKNFLAESQYRWKLSEPMRMILDHFHGPFSSAEHLAQHAKACRIPLTKTRPIEEAISSSGGIPWQTITDQLMIKSLPGVFVAGEMIDWEAPTGGYLLQGCFASGTRAAEAALAFKTSTSY